MKITKSCLTIFLTLLYTLNIQAQNVEIKGTNAIYSKERKNFITKKVYLSDDKLIVLRIGGVNEWGYIFDKNEFDIDMYELKGEFEVTKTIKYSFNNEKDIEKIFLPELTLVRNNRIYFFADFFDFDKKIKSFQVKQVDFNLELIEDWKPVLEMKDKDDLASLNSRFRNYASLEIKVIPYEDNFFVTAKDYESYNSKKNTWNFEELSINIYSSNFNEISSTQKKLEFNRKVGRSGNLGGTHTLEYDKLLTTVYCAAEGNLFTGFLIGNIKGLRLGGTSRNKFFKFYEEVEMHYAFDYEEGFNKITINLPESRLMHNYSYVIDTLNQAIVFSGIYAKNDGKKYPLEGTFLLVFDIIEGKMVAEEYTPFSENVKVFAQSNVGGFSERFSLSKKKLTYQTHTSILNNGNILLMLEYLGEDKFAKAFYRENEMVISGAFCNDLLVFEYDRNGKVVKETTIDKQMYTERERLYSTSYSILQNEGMFHIVFCDNRKNYNQSGEYEPTEGKVKKALNNIDACLVSVFLDVDGKWKRKILAEGFNKDGFLPDIYFDKINNNVPGYIIFHDNKKVAVGKLVFRQK